MTNDQMKAIRMIADAIVDSVREAGSHGAPAGVLYAAMMAHGCSLENFEGLMSLLVQVGRFRKSGHLYFVQEVRQ